MKDSTDDGEVGGSKNWSGSVGASIGLTSGLGLNIGSISEVWARISAWSIRLGKEKLGDFLGWAIWRTFPSSSQSPKTLQVGFKLIGVKSGLGVVHNVGWKGISRSNLERSDKEILLDGLRVGMSRDVKWPFLVRQVGSWSGYRVKRHVLGLKNNLVKRVF